jgi:hypothetical protein
MAAKWWAAKYWLMSAVALSGCMAATGAEAAKRGAKPPPPIVGCTHPTAPFCIGVTTSKGKTYALFGANPFIPLGAGVTVWGQETGASPCGPAIQVVKWQPNRKIKCKR